MLNIYTQSAEAAAVDNVFHMHPIYDIAIEFTLGVKGCKTHATLKPVFMFAILPTLHMPFQI